LKPHLRFEVLEPSTVCLLDEHRSHALTGDLYRFLVPLLDGRRTVAEIIRELAGDASPLGVWMALERLDRRGFLAEGGNREIDAADVYWSRLGVDPSAARDRLGAALIRVAGIGGLSSAPLVEVLRDSGFEGAVGEDGAAIHPDLTVVVSDDYLRPELEEENRRALASGSPWMLVKPVGTTVWLGPILVPGETGCWRCLAFRLRHDAPVRATTETALGDEYRPPAPAGSLVTTRAAVWNLVATEIAAWWVRGRRVRRPGGARPSSDRSFGAGRSLVGRLATLDLASLGMEHHAVVRRPQCGDCGAGGDPPSEPRPVELETRGKCFIADGGHRSVGPVETYRRFAHLVSPITGIVKEMFRIDPGTADVAPVYAAVYSSGWASSVEGLRGMLRDSAAGKGKTDDQARASGLAEAIERYSGIFTGETEITRRARIEEHGDAAVHPASILQLSDRQYRTRERWNAEHPVSSCWVPEPYDEDIPIHWTPMWSLTQEVFRQVPTSICYFGFSEPEGPRFWVADSNGNAAGNNLEEAILQGFMELVERDAVGIWWYNRLPRPRVDLSSFDDGYLKAVESAFGELGRELWVLDLTTDLGIPAVVAVSRRTSGDGDEVTFGAGAHFDPDIAVLRAVTECNQGTWTLRGHREAGLRGGAAEGEPAEWLLQLKVADNGHLLPDDRASVRGRGDFTDLSSDDLRDDVRRCVEIAASRGLETLVLDQTRPDIGMSVVKVVVPGLRHFWPRFAPGRLYGVPVAMGWLPGRPAEEDLNPVPWAL